MIHNPGNEMSIIKTKCCAEAQKSNAMEAE
jgi:hypothetical protein